MVEQSTVRTIVLGVVVFVTLHALVASFATKSKSGQSKSDDESIADEESEILKPWRERVR